MEGERNVVQRLENNKGETQKGRETGYGDGENKYEGSECGRRERYKMTRQQFRGGKKDDGDIV